MSIQENTESYVKEFGNSTVTRADAHVFIF